ncbi:MAG: hypothetical protein ACI9XO_001668 [Paraglaciecola sp.]|jgi:uncharacterized protein (DUF2141 family)
MKNFIIAFIIGCPVFLFGQNTVTVQFSKIKPIQGKIYVGLYDSAGNFMKADKNFQNCITAVNGNKAECVLENIPNGKYAISVFHDENSNGELDTGMFGIPKEGYGFSNNAKGVFGPPSFEDSSFEVKGNVVQKIDF